MNILISKLILLITSIIYIITTKPIAPKVQKPVNVKSAHVLIVKMGERKNKQKKKTLTVEIFLGLINDAIIPSS